MNTKILLIILLALGLCYDLYLIDEWLATPALKAHYNFSYRVRTIQFKKGNIHGIFYDHDYYRSKAK